MSVIRKCVENHPTYLELLELQPNKQNAPNKQNVVLSF